MAEKGKKKNLPLPSRVKPADVPNADDYVEQEPTPITDMRGLFDKTRKNHGLIKRLVEHDIPKVAQEAGRARAAADEAKEHVIIVRTRQEDMGKRLERIEKNGHPCKFEKEIDTLKEESKEWRVDKEEGIKTRGMVKGLQEGIDRNDKAIESFSKGRMKALIGAIMGFVGIIATVGGTSYCIGTSITTVSRDLAAEREMRQTQHKAVTEKLDAIPTKSDVPSKTQFTKLQKTLKNGDDEKCAKLSPQQKRRLVSQVRQGLLPPSFLCP